MTKALDAIRTELTGKRHHVRGTVPIHVVADTQIREIDFNTMQEYRCELKMGVSIVCKREYLKHAEENAYQQIREFLYGDLYQRLLKLEQAMYRGDPEVYRPLLRDLITTVRG